MEDQAAQIIRKGFFGFQKEISFCTSGDASSLVRGVLNREPVLLYYLQGYTLTGVGNRFQLKVEYHNTDMDRSDIQVLQKASDCEEMICQYVGKYRKKMAVIVKGTADWSGIGNAFLEKYGTFYPNLTLVSANAFSFNLAYSGAEFSFRYRIGYVKLAQMEIEVDREVKRIASMLFLPDAPPEAKVYLAHNYLASTVKYVDNDENRLEESYTQSAYGALIRKACVCQGFAEAFKRLMDIAGVECSVVYGRITGSSGFHAWNIVSLKQANDYYHVDTTWDAGGVKPEYTYFCRNDAFFTGKRTWNRTYTQKCSTVYPALQSARRYIWQNRARLLSHGVSQKILDC